MVRFLGKNAPEIRGKEEKVFYSIRDKTRRKQIVSWFHEEMAYANTLQNFRQIIAEYKGVARFKAFKATIDQTLPEDHTLFYILAHMAEEVGEDDFLLIMYNDLVMHDQRGKGRLTSKNLDKKVPPQAIEQAVGQARTPPVPDRRKYFYGYLPTGKRRKGIISHIYYKKDNSYRMKLRDPKTGRFLRSSESFNKRTKV